MSLDKAGFNMLQGMYQNAYKPVVAASVAWAAARTVSKLGLDPKTTMVFAAAVATLYYGTKPLFDGFNCQNQKRDIASRSLALLGLTWITKDLLKLNLPMKGPFVKATIVASAAFALIEGAELGLEYIKQKKS